MLTIDLAGVDELSSGQTKLVPFDGKAPYRSIILVKTVESFRAYWNICKHVSIPLDGGVGILPLVKNKLVCQTHGASYRSEDGLCVNGPCKDESLDAIDIKICDERVVALITNFD